MVRVLCIVSSLPTITAWVPSAIWYSDPGHTFDEVVLSHGAINRLWDFPDSVWSQEGLGGGLTYAWDPTLCERLLPLFREELSVGNFIDCGALRAAWSRALNTWAVHHPRVSFTDVTPQCESASDTSGGPVDSEGCSLAQIWVTTKSTQTGTEAAGSATSNYIYSTDFRHTDGRTATGGVWKTNGTVIGFNVNSPLCWYLDSLFCSRFHSLKEQFGSVEVLTAGKVLLWGTFVAALLNVAWVAQRLARKHHRLTDVSSGRALEAERDRLKSQASAAGPDLLDDERWREMMDEVTMSGLRLLDEVSKISILWTSLRLLCVWAPPTFYLYIFLPCWECYDFEAAAVHEIGHALGLTHPDKMNVGDAALLNFAWQSEAAPCDDPWLDVEQLGPTKEASASIMLALTQFNTEVCLQQDDLDGLNTLYPVCDNRVLTPQCFKTQSYIGLVRVAALIGVPVTLMMWTIVACNAAVTRWQTKRRDKARAESEQELTDLEKQLKRLKAKDRRHKLETTRNAWVNACRTSKGDAPASQPVGRAQSPSKGGRRANRHASKSGTGTGKYRLPLSPQRTRRVSPTPQPRQGSQGSDEADLAVEAPPVEAPPAVEKQMPLRTPSAGGLAAELDERRSSRGRHKPTVTSAGHSTLPPLPGETEQPQGDAPLQFLQGLAQSKPASPARKPSVLKRMGTTKAPRASAAVAPAEPPAASLPPGWYEAADQASGTTYYYHGTTGQVTWARPDE